MPVKIAAFTNFSWMAWFYPGTHITNKGFSLFLLHFWFGRTTSRESQREQEQKPGEMNIETIRMWEKIRKLDNWKGKWLAPGTKTKMWGKAMKYIILSLKVCVVGAFCNIIFFTLTAFFRRFAPEIGLSNNNICFSSLSALNIYYYFFSFSFSVFLSPFSAFVLSLSLLFAGSDCVCV